MDYTQLKIFGLDTVNELSHTKPDGSMVQVCEADSDEERLLISLYYGNVEVSITRLPYRTHIVYSIYRDGALMAANHIEWGIFKEQLNEFLKEIN